MSIRWGLSVLDWRDHAINKSRDHPSGVLKAECGHLLIGGPVSRPPARWARSQLDHRIQLLGPVSEDTGGALRARSGAPLALVTIQHNRPPPGPPCESCSQSFLAEFTVARGE